VGFSPSGPVKANRGVRARIPAAGKVLEGDDQRTLSPLYYDLLITPKQHIKNIQKYRH